MEFVILVDVHQCGGGLKTEEALMKSSYMLTESQCLTHSVSDDLPLLLIS